MNEAIELHDSELGAVTLTDDTAILSLRPANLHRSAGRPGSDAGSGWSQDATITILGVTHADVLSNPMPITISDGFLRIESHVYENIIPAPANFAAAIELRLVPSNCDAITIRGGHIKIELSGPATYIEKFGASRVP